jgi:hypothetical protein
MSQTFSVLNPADGEVVATVPDQSGEQVAPRLPTLRSDPLWYPYTPLRMRAISRALRAITARDLRRRLGI